MQALAAGRSASVQPRTDKIDVLELQKQRDTVLEDYDEDILTPMNRKSYMVKEDSGQQAKTKAGQSSKEKNKKEALAAGRSKTNMSHNEKERAPAKNVRKNNLKLDKTEESKSPSRNVSPTTSMPKKP